MGRYRGASQQILLSVSPPRVSTFHPNSHRISTGKLTAIFQQGDQKNSPGRCFSKIYILFESVHHDVAKDGGHHDLVYQSAGGAATTEAPSTTNRYGALSNQTWIPPAIIAKEVRGWKTPPQQTYLIPNVGRNNRYRPHYSPIPRLSNCQH